MIKRILGIIAISVSATTGFAQTCPTIQMSGQDVECYGESNGEATVSIFAASIGNSWTYTWSTTDWESGPQTSSTLQNLAAGTYTVTVQDNVTGCSVVGAYVVGSPDPISVSESITNVDCYDGSTGAIAITTYGGSGTYGYSWNSGQTTEDISGVPAGNYTLTITDSPYGCSYVETFTITQPAEAVQLNYVQTNATCDGAANGAIDLNVWGGTPPYSYVWSNSASTQDVNGLIAGSYNVTVTDFNDCTTNPSPQNFLITDPAPITGPMITDDVDCYGDPTGNVSVDVSGGTAPYSYSWQNATTLFADNNDSLLNVVAGDYQVTVTDANGCVFVNTATINQPTELTATHTYSNVSCYGGTDGSIDVTVQGGTVPYSYVWVNSLGDTVSYNQDLTNVPAEDYSVLITDANGCTYSIDQTITQPLIPITVTETVYNVLCFGDNTGAIELDVVGGTAPFGYSWTSGQTTEDIYNLIADTYGYTIVDANGCTSTGVVVVSEPAQPLTVTNVITDVNCFGESNGGIDLTVTGGTAPYTYSWSNSTYELSNTNQDLINYPADWYRFEVTDANGCNVVDTLTITEPPLLVATVTGVDILCYGGNNGSVDLTVVGGTMPYAYLWNTGDVTEDLMNLTAGYYAVTVTDDHGCTDTASITLTQPADTLSYTYTVEDVLCKDGTDGSIELDIEGGTIPYDYAWSNGDTVAHIVNLTAGWYEFVVTDNNGCILTDSLYVDEPDAVTLNEVITPVTCYGMSDGVIDISPVGGTLPYSYTWYNSQFALSAQTEDLVNWPADIYQLEIIDSNGCFYEMFLEIEQPDPLVIEYTYNVVSCAGGIDGNINVDIYGGNPGYTTTWSNGATTEDLLNIPADVYELTVVDTKGCIDSIAVDISQPDSIKIDFEVTEISCIDDHDGVAFAYPYGGNGGYFYNWSNGETNSVNSGLSNVWYSLTVTDVLGCVGYDSVFIPKSTIGCIDPVNTFTPNGDAYNDTWVIDNMELYPDAHVQVFNKWGNLIHEQIGLYEPWDGTINESPAPSEIYYWIINLNYPDRDILKGNITIVR